MSRLDYTVYLEQKTLVAVARAFFSDNFADTVSKIPEEIISEPLPETSLSLDETRRLIVLRVLAALGVHVNSGLSLRAAAEQALSRSRLEEPVLMVASDLCHHCPDKQYVVTGVCQGCLARPCTSCPFGAIEFVDGKSHINRDKCKKCGICVKSCPYHAIVQTEPPCVATCPVDAIAKDESGAACIDPDRCIACGQCSKACPFGVIQTRSQMIDVLKAIQSGQRVVAMLAPAILGQYGVSVGQLFSAVKEAGFSEVIEVATGADITARNEAGELAERLARGDSFMTTSCCSAYFDAVRKHIPDLARFVSDTKTPMHYTAEIVKQRDASAVTVFIGPCMAKREEGIHDEFVDFVLNGKELTALFAAKNITPTDCPELDTPHPSKQGRGFALTGGVAGAVQSLYACDVCSVCIDGLTKETMKQLHQYAKTGKAAGSLVEVMACCGGCVAGPGVAAPIKQATKEIQKLVVESPDLNDI